MGELFGDMSRAPTPSRGDNPKHPTRQPRGLAIREDVLAPALFKRLRRRVSLLGSERLRQTYQTTFWFDLQAPASVVELAILEIRPQHAPTLINLGTIQYNRREFEQAGRAPGIHSG